MMPTGEERDHGRIPAPPFITAGQHPQGVNTAGPGATALGRGPAGGLSTATSGHAATSKTIPGPERHGDLQRRPFQRSLLARCALAVGIGFALPLGIAATALLTASADPDSVGPWRVLLDLFHHTWTGPIARLVPILALPFFGLAPLVALVAIAALVELARPGQATRAHTVPRRSSRQTP